MTVESLQTPDPHYIPGYTGYCPQYIFRAGHTYGSLTNRLLIDPCISHAEKLILADRSLDDYHLKRPTLTEIDVVRMHELNGDPVYKHPMIPGYEAFIPTLRNQIGHRYSIAATDAISEFEKHMQKLRCDRRKLKHRGAVVDNSAYSRSIGERSLFTTDYRLPLADVRPEAVGFQRNLSETLPPCPPPLPYSKETPPHFMLENDPEKYIKKGFCGHIPFAESRFGHTNKCLTCLALCDFLQTYNSRKRTEWAPVRDFGLDEHKEEEDNSILYPKCTGMIPNYAGHVPGDVSRFGTTFGKGTVNAKQWLREDNY